MSAVCQSMERLGLRKLNPLCFLGGSMDVFIFLAFSLPDKQRKLFSAMKSKFYALYQLLCLFLSFLCHRKLMQNVHYHLVRFLRFLKEVSLMPY